MQYTAQPPPPPPFEKGGGLVPGDLFAREQSYRSMLRIYSDTKSECPDGRVQYRTDNPPKSPFEKGDLLRATCSPRSNPTARCSGYSGTKSERPDGRVQYTAQPPPFEKGGGLAPDDLFAREQSCRSMLRILGY